MYFVNKNINYGGRVYAQGAEIKDGDPGFKELLSAGHVGQSGAAPASPALAAPAPAEVKPSVPVPAKIEAKAAAAPSPKVIKRKGRPS